MNASSSNKSGARRLSSPRVTGQQETLALQRASETIRGVAELSHALRNASATLEKIVSVTAGMTHLTLAHGLVLAHLMDKSTSKQADLRSATGIGPAYLSKLLDELAGQKLLRRHRSSTDRRQILLAPTTLGTEVTRRLLLAVSELVTQSHRALIADLSSSVDQFVTMMRL